MKIIFLDIDGVITSARIMPAYRTFDRHAVDYLKWICNKSGALIVISSTWRYNHRKEFFQKYFDLHPDWEIPDLCRKLESGIFTASTRGKEIQEWLDKHEVESYAILDDDTDFLENQKPFHIKTDSLNGILFEHWKRLREMFGIKTGEEYETT